MENNGKEQLLRHRDISDKIMQPFIKKPLLCFIGFLLLIAGGNQTPPLFALPEQRLPPCCLCHFYAAVGSFPEQSENYLFLSMKNKLMCIVVYSGVKTIVI